jgi:hypothetical protein
MPRGLNMKRLKARVSAETIANTSGILGLWHVDPSLDVQLPPEARAA